MRWYSARLAPAARHEGAMTRALLFPGESSPCPAMGQAWTSHPSWVLVERASSILDLDIEWLLLHGGVADLTAPQNAHVTTFVLSLVVLAALRDLESART